MWQWTSITVCPSVVEAQPNVEWRRGSHDANGPGPERPTPERVGCVYSVGSGCAGVFVDQAAESVPSLDSVLARWCYEPERWLLGSGWPESEAAVRPVGVVVLDIDAEDVLEMPAAADQDPVEALASVVGHFQTDPLPSVGCWVSFNWRDRRAAGLGVVRCSGRESTDAKTTRGRNEMGLAPVRLYRANTT
jgi:hypothetical protein